MRPRHWLLLVLAALAGLGGGWLVQPPPGGDTGPGGGLEQATGADVDASDAGADAVRGERRPDFTLPGVDGGEVSVADFAGDILVLNFWATWCPPCIEEVPMLIELHDDRADDGVRVLGVAVEGPDAVRGFAAEYGIDYPLAADRRGGFAVAAEYGNPQGVMPYTVFIDRDGIVRDVHRGQLSREQAEAKLAPMLEEG